MTPEWKKQPVILGRKGRPRTILVTGATGFIGRSLCRKLLENGDEVIVLTRDANKADNLFGPAVKIVTDLELLAAETRIDAVISLAGASVVGGRWTKKRKRLLVESRVSGLRELEALINRLNTRPKVLVNASATGFYGMRGDEELTEFDSGQNVFQSHLCRAREVAATRLEDYGVRVCNLRIGLVFDKDGGAFNAMALPVRLGLGAVFGDGKQWMSWIYKPDLLRLILFCLSQPHLRGAINATTPYPVTNRDFTLTLARHYKKPVFFRLPAFLLKLLLGEMSQLFLRGQKVIPEKALRANFGFNQATLEKMFLAMDKQDETEELKVYYNHACPVCRTEIAHYQGIARHHNSHIHFKDISKAGSVPYACGLSRQDMRRRLYVFDQDGRLKSGIDAFIAIWKSLPPYRWLATVFKLPVLHQLGDLAYDYFFVPFLARLNMLRERFTLHDQGVL